MADFWMDNAFASKEPLPHTLVDLGYVNAELSRERAEKMLKVISKKNLQIVGSGRIVIRIPPAEVADVLSQFPEIKTAADRPGYCWCTHTWISPETTDIKYAW